jgi:dihydrofolate reductase|tara:strand:+ start:806 stop:1318 length:513 start_codon:yes stop_codon:yes gene_type:complete
MKKISLIVAVAKNNVIGSNGKMPWDLPSDLSNFKEITMNKPMIMGRKTFDSIGRALPGRDNIVVSRNPDISYEGAIMCKNIQDAISIGEKCADKRGVDEVMVIGGQYIFESVMSETQKIYLTEVDSSPKGDVFFPNFNLDNFIEISKNEFTQDEGDSCMHRLVVYEKKAF